MSKFYSTEQASEIAKLIGFLLAFTPAEIPHTELNAVVSAVLVLGGIGYSWFKRYQRGDLRLSGVRK